MKIAKSFTFESAHFIKDHPRCGCLHGHTWTLTVFLEDNVLNKEGMLLDFSVLGGVVKLILAEIDHKVINDAYRDKPFFQDKPITAETLVVYLTHQIERELILHLNYAALGLGCRLQEGPGGWAEYWLGEVIDYGC